MERNYYTYKQADYACAHCGWKGSGSETSYAEHYDYGFTIACPKCNKELPGLVPFPTISESLQYGDAEERERALSTQKFWDQVERSQLKRFQELPELEGERLKFQIRESKEGETDYIEIWEGTTQVWKELRTWEYYKRFIEMGNMLKRKYGRRMVDFDPSKASVYLCGDRIAAIGEVAESRRRWQHQNEKGTW